MPVVLANHAQVLRSIQRDNDAVRQIHDNVKEVIGELTGNAGIGSKFVQFALPIVTRLGYYGATTVMGKQTLGEEYVGIVLAYPNLTVPSRIALLWVVMIRVLGPHLINHTISVWERSVRKSGQGAIMSEETFQREKLVCVVKEVYPLLQIVQNGIFYLSEQFFDLAMWLTGIRYVLVRSWFQDKKASRYFKLLGIITLLHFVVSATDKFIKLRYMRLEDYADTKVSGSIDSRDTCYLCLEKRKNTSATPCGHLFCWKCIIEALRAKNVCPICRERVLPSRVVILQNYD